MKKETLDKLRQYIDLAANHAYRSAVRAHPSLAQEDAREQAWQEFVEADLAEKQKEPRDE